jgi:hypothetical protein
MRMKTKVIGVNVLAMLGNLAVGIEGVYAGETAGAFNLLAALACLYIICQLAALGTGRTALDSFEIYRQLRRPRTRFNHEDNVNWKRDGF